LDETNLRRGEGARVISANRVSGWLTGVTVKTTRDVDGELSARLSVDPVDRCVKGRSRLAACTGAEHRVNEPGAVARVMVELLMES
jgi:hypothetical protein